LRGHYEVGRGNALPGIPGSDATRAFAAIIAVAAGCVVLWVSGVPGRSTALARSVRGAVIAAAVIGACGSGAVGAMIELEGGVAAPAKVGRSTSLRTSAQHVASSSKFHRDAQR